MNNNTVDVFLNMVDSLRRHQRAELLNEEEESIIENLYTDPLEGDFILKSMLYPQTTLLIGRKGTGKSTIIGRFQHEIRKTENQLSLYLDVRTIYEQSIGSVPLTNFENELLSEHEIKKYQLYKHFLNNIINEIKNEIKKSVFSNKFITYITNKGITEKDFRRKLDEIYEDITKEKFEDLTLFKQLKLKEQRYNKDPNSKSTTSSLGFDPKIKVGADGVDLHIISANIERTKKSGEQIEDLNTKEYSLILMRYFNIIDFINRIRDLLLEAGIKRVFICLDDASELDESALDVFMRTIVVPLNNSTEEFYKFKISFYPGRDHLPEIDRTKIDTINLDYFDLYQSTGVDKIEESAIAYTKRLIEKRFKYFFGNAVNLNDFFDTKNLTLESYYKLIFQASANVPRNIGKLLWYAAKRSIFQFEKITKSVLQDAAKEHYTQEIEPLLYKNEYIQYKNYNEKFEREHLKRLLDLIVEKARENKRKIGSSSSEIFKEYNPNNAPSNYLYIPIQLEEFLSTLELNFFISKYAQQKDRGSMHGKEYIPPKDVSIYTLNYGLCQSNNIIVDEKSNRKFRIERVFDFTELIMSWAKGSQIIKCSSCGAIHNIDRLEAIKQFGMLCDKCYNKTCSVETVEIEIPDDTPIQIKEKDFQVLNVLKVENGLSSPQIAQELDVSYQSVNQRIRYDRFLMTSKFIDKQEKEGVNKYYITDNALNVFFS
jgi:hypothetical protein